MSTSPFAIIRAAYKQVNPDVKPKGRGWNAIFYGRYSLEWWRKQYLLHYVARRIKALSPKIRVPSYRLPTKSSEENSPTRLFAKVYSPDDVQEVMALLPGTGIQVDSSKSVPQLSLSVI